MCQANVKGLWADWHCWHVVIYSVLFSFFCFIFLYIFLIFSQILVADVLWGRLRNILYEQNEMFYLGYVFFFSKILKTVIFLCVLCKCLIAMTFSTTDKKCIWFLSFSMFSREQPVLVFGPELPGRRTGRGGAGPPLSNSLGGWIDSVSPRRDGDVRRAAACSVSDSEGNKQWKNQQELNGNAPCGDTEVVPQWAAELRTTGVDPDGTWRQPGSSLWPSASAPTPPEDHRWSWTPRYSCQ